MARFTILAVALVAVLGVVAATEDLVQVEYAKAPAQWTRGGRVEPMHAMELIIAVKQTNAQVLEDIVLAVSNPKSPMWGQHLSSEEVDNLVAPEPEDIIRVLTWLNDNEVDMSEIEASGNSDFLTVYTNCATAERLLNAQFHYWTHNEHSKTTVIRVGNGAYHVPASVADAIDFVGPSVRFPAINKLIVRPKPDSVGVTPSFLRTLYKVGDATGTASNNNQSVAQFLGQYYSPSDLSSFFTQFAPSEDGKTPTVNGPNDDQNPGIEASLDIEYIMSVATNIPTTFWSTSGQQPHNPGNEPFLAWLTRVAVTTGNDAPKTVSVSYGDNEASVNLQYAIRVNSEFKKLGARGISLMFASGDGGVSGSQPTQCTEFVPTFPAASPWVTAVGGTQNYNPEVAAGLSAGGFSNYWARPEYQVAAVKEYLTTASGIPAASHFNQTGAGFPDVSAQAENFNIVYSGFTTFVAGTSCASPTFSSVVSLINDARLAAGKSPLGYLNPTFYQNPGMFTDITSGSNPGCGTNGFPAAKGWDPVTGLGTANYESMKSVLMALP